MTKNKFSMYFLACLLVGTVTFSCKNDDDEKTQEKFDAQIEELALSPKWNNYLLAASEELYEDCVKLYAAWAGPDALSLEESAIIGDDLFTELQAPIGYAALVKNPNASEYLSATTAVEQTIVQGSIDIAGEVGEQKIGGPNQLANDGQTTQAVLEVESWYSFNSIEDYTNNIVSIRSSYFGGKDSTSAQENSLSAFVRSKNPNLNTEIIAAINAAHGAITAMTAPFRSNLKGDNVDAAMDACAELADILEGQLIPFVRGNADEAAYTAILRKYADEIVVATYEEMKNKAKDLRDAVRSFVATPSQNNLDAAATAWRETRTPWEQSEAFLYGPADLLELDPSLDSWPLDQRDIYNILTNNMQSVDDIRSEIGVESRRGFHTIELLLFKDGLPRVVK